MTSDPALTIVMRLAKATNNNSVVQVLVAILAHAIFQKLINIEKKRDGIREMQLKDDFSDPGRGTSPFEVVPSCGEAG
jgi:hypothetical protein